MRKLRILVDMDDTVEYLLYAWVDRLNEKHDLSVQYSDIQEWDISIAFPTLTREQVFAPLFEDDFWETVKPMPDAAEVLKWAIDEGHEVYIVTASAYQTIKSKMENVLFKHFPFISWENVFIAQNKQMIRGDILIDDAPHNLEGGDYAKLLMTASHNQTYDAYANGMTRVYNWYDVKACIFAIAHADELKGSWPSEIEHVVSRIQLQNMLGGTH